MKKIMMIASMLACMLAMTPYAFADVITFNTLAGDLETTVTEGDYTFTALGTEYGDAGVFYAVTDADVDSGYYYGDSAALINDVATVTLLTSASATPFNLDSIDFAELFASWEDDGSVDVVTITLNAIFADGTIGTYTLDTDGAEGFQTFELNLENLAVVSFVGSDAYGYTNFEFDNVVLNDYDVNGSGSSVPVPSSFLLLFAGMSALAASRRNQA